MLLPSGVLVSHVGNPWSLQVDFLSGWGAASLDRVEGFVLVFASLKFESLRVGRGFLVYSFLICSASSVPRAVSFTKFGKHHPLFPLIVSQARSVCPVFWNSDNANVGLSVTVLQVPEALECCGYVTWLSPAPRMWSSVILVSLSEGAFG